MPPLTNRRIVAPNVDKYRFGPEDEFKIGMKLRFGEYLARVIASYIQTDSSTGFSLITTGLGNPDYYGLQIVGAPLSEHVFSTAQYLPAEWSDVVVWYNKGIWKLIVDEVEHDADVSIGTVKLNAPEAIAPSFGSGSVPGYEMDDIKIWKHNV